MFSNSLKRMKTGPTQFAAPTSLFNYYSQYRNSLAARVLKDGKISIGQVSWRSTADVTFLKDGSEVVDQYEGVPRLFMGADQEEHLPMDEEAQ